MEGAVGHIAQPSEHGIHKARDGGLPEQTDAERGERHAELYGGDVGLDVVRDAGRQLRSAASGVRKLVQLRRTDADERILGRDEEPIHQHEDECDEDGRTCVHSRSFWH